MQIHCDIIILISIIITFPKIDKNKNKFESLKSCGDVFLMIDIYRK